MSAAETTEALMVRIYLAGTETQRNLLLRRLRDWEQTRGATVFTGVAGFGDSGSARGDEIPTVLEFFDEKEQALRVVEDLKLAVADAHIVYWPVTVAATSGPGPSRP